MVVKQGAEIARRRVADAIVRVLTDGTPGSVLDAADPVLLYLIPAERELFFAVAASAIDETAASEVLAELYSNARSPIPALYDVADEADYWASLASTAELRTWPQAGVGFPSGTGAASSHACSPGRPHDAG